MQSHVEPLKFAGVVGNATEGERRCACTRGAAGGALAAGSLGAVALPALTALPKRSLPCADLENFSPLELVEQYVAQRPVGYCTPEQPCSEILGGAAAGGLGPGASWAAACMALHAPVHPVGIAECCSRKSCPHAPPACSAGRRL